VSYYSQPGIIIATDPLITIGTGSVGLVANHTDTVTAWDPYQGSPSLKSLSMEPTFT